VSDRGLVEAKYKLPKVIKEIEGYTPFVKALKIFLVEKCYYNVDDYNKEIWQS